MTRSKTQIQPLAVPHTPALQRFTVPCPIYGFWTAIKVNQSGNISAHPRVSRLWLGFQDLIRSQGTPVVADQLLICFCPLEMSPQTQFCQQRCLQTSPTLSGSKNHLKQKPPDGDVSINSAASFFNLGGLEGRLPSTQLCSWATSTSES